MRFRWRGSAPGWSDNGPASSAPNPCVALGPGRAFPGPPAARGIALALDGPVEPCPLLGDGHLLARVIENLLDNALRHTPAGGQIGVRWSRKDATLVFAVEDTGPGIAAHDLPHLFTPLYRGEASRNRQTGGAGLGPSIAPRILRAHGGDLMAANSLEGGAVFTGTLPASSQAHPPANLVTAAGA